MGHPVRALNRSLVTFWVFCVEVLKSVRSKDFSQRQGWTSSWGPHLEGNWELKDLGDREVNEKLSLVSLEIPVLT